MAIDANRILKELIEDAKRRGPVTLYLDKVLYNQFRKLCGPIAPGKVVDALIQDFIRENSTPSAKKDRK